MTKDKSNKSKEVLKKILGLLNIKAKIVEEYQNDIYKISLECKDAPLLIGYHGENLLALQYIVNLLIKSRTAEEKYIFLDVSGYRKEQEEKLEGIALSAASKVKKGGKFEVLRPMTGYERRLVHLALLNDPGVITESIGKEPNRRVVIKLKRK